jgi:hypothetical protein
MRTLLRLFAFVSIIVLIAMGCHKDLSYEEMLKLNSDKGFSSAFVKNWYYGSFIKTAEWSGSAEKKEKQPDWENGTKTMIGKLEAVEYPFIKGKSSYSISGDNSVTPAEAQKIAAASISKIIFIKTDNNQILVREINYVPDWVYLQSKKFNIGDMKSVTDKSDFTGRVIVKNWGGSILSTQVQIDGKTVKIGKKVTAKKAVNNEGVNSLTQGCLITTYCIWQQDCIITYNGDIIAGIECGPWFNTGECWQEENCSGGGDDGGGGGDDGGGGPDPCQTYGACSCDPSLASPQEIEFNNYVLVKSSSQVNVDANITAGGPAPIIGVTNWVVTEGSTANWQIKANTQYSYYHTTIINIPANTTEESYDLFNYQTVSSYYVGSNTFIQSTWTQTSVQDQVLNNKTTYTQGKSVVHGTIRHVLSLPFSAPYCPKALDQTVEIDPNTLNFTPR